MRRPTSRQRRAARFLVRKLLHRGRVSALEVLGAKIHGRGGWQYIGSRMHRYGAEPSAVEDAWLSSGKSWMGRFVRGSAVG